MNLKDVRSSWAWSLCQMTKPHNHVAASAIAKRLLCSLVLLLVLVNKSVCAQAATPAVAEKHRAPEKTQPAFAAALVIPSHGEKLLGMFYGAAGVGDRPTVVLLHGFPGFEQNLDLAQAIRRAGWSVLALHYRGSWGVGGDFSLAHAIEDSDAIVAFARSPAARQYHIDPKRIAVVGHSMGGFLAAAATAHEPAVLGTVMIGTWDITAPARGVAMPHEQLVAKVETEDGSDPDDFLPLHGTGAHSLAVEIVDHRDDWDLIKFAPGIGLRPVLLLTADDDSRPGSIRFQKALQAAGNTHVSETYTKTDHDFSGERIHLESMVVKWLASLAK